MTLNLEGLDAGILGLADGHNLHAGSHAAAGLNGDAGELGGQLLLGAIGMRLRLGGVIGIGVAELHDEIVLRAIDAGAVPEAASRHRLDVGDVRRRESGRQFDDHAPAGQFHVQRVGRV